MKIFYDLGITDKEFKNILELCPEISNLSNDELSKNIDLLKHLGLINTEIKEIILENPFYLNRLYDDIVSLINTLLKLNFEDVINLIINNPFILNKDVYEIEKFVTKQINHGKSLQLIIHEIEDNPYIINTI